jgi:phage gp16-like protein
MWITNDERIMAKVIESIEQRGYRMAETISEKQTRNLIAQIKHAAIDCTFVDLGIVKYVTVKGDKVTVTLAFPFAKIPIKLWKNLVQAVLLAA